MAKSRLRCMTVLAAAGLACSIAAAQKDGSTPLQLGGRIAPAYIEYGGRRIDLPAPPVTDDIQIIYENGAFPFPGASGYFLTTSVPKWHTLDQISFNPGPGAGAGRTFNAMVITLSAGTVTTGATDPLDVLVTFWDTLTPASTPATSNQIGQTMRIGFNAPAAGWATNTVYASTELSLTTFNLTSADDLVYIDMAMVTAGGNSPANAHPWASCAFYSAAGAVGTVGSSPPVAPAVPSYWRDANGNGAIDAGEERTFAAPNVANFAFGLKADAPPAVTGACCLPDGSCTVLSQSACTGQFGTYQGDNTACGAVPCPNPGACCLVDGSCVLSNSAGCTAKFGTYSGNGTPCGSCPQPSAIIYNNGPVSTGATTQGAQAAPAGATWSEVANNTNEPTIANTTAGYSAAGTNRLADNFTVTSPGGWRIDSVVVKGYQTGSGVVYPTINSGTLRIWNGNPASGGTVVFGDTSTNRFQGSIFSTVYRCFNTIVPPQCGGAVTNPDTSRPLMDVYLNGGATVLPPGTYWIDYGLAGSLGSGPFCPDVTVQGTRQPVASSDAQQFTTAWAAIVDAGQGCTPTAVPQELSFVLRGAVLGGSVCYPNCDGSTIQPCLNVQDFGCFLNKFGTGDTYANCDNSTIPPVLNVQDFGCFLNKFGNGCSSC